MDSKKRNILFGVLGFFAIALIALMILNSYSVPDDRYHWRRTFENDGKNPFDTYVIYNLIKNSADSGDFIESKRSFKNFEWDENELLNYIFIGDAAYYSGEDVDALLNFVEKGNNAFIAQENINVSLYDRALGLDSSNIYLEFYRSNELVSCLGMKDCYTFDYTNGIADSVENDWYYFYGLPHNDSIEYLGRVDGKEVNFYRTKHGKGYFYFHSTPLLFTNYYLADSLNWQYANKIFGFLPGKRFYWDKHAYLNYAEMNDEAFQNPLKHILASKSLLWAWYLMIVLIILFLLLNSKRRQNNIPFLEPNENSTIEFTETIGQLYFKEQNHFKIIQLMMKMFLFNLYARYRIPVHKSQDEQTLSRLSKKTGVDQKMFDLIVEKYNAFMKANFAKSEDLIHLYKQINNYNNSCK